LPGTIERWVPAFAGKRQKRRVTTQAAAPALRVDNIRLGILYMVASVFLFSIQNARYHVDV
jgi:hypothetical protein